MDKVIDLSKSVYEICDEYPEVIGKLMTLGFESLEDSTMRNTAGRFVTLPRAAKMKNVPLDKIKDMFRIYGYEIKE